MFLSWNSVLFGRWMLSLAVLTCLFTVIESTGQSPASPLPDLTSSAVPRTSVKPETCMFGLGTCINGHCYEFSNGNQMCICNKGWIGIFCNHECPMPCVHGQCRIHSNRQYCNCYNHTVTGEFCDLVNSKPEITISTGLDHLTKIETTTNQYVGTDIVPVTSMKGGMCLYGLARCLHGYCVTMANGQTCSCYAGWTGLLCTQACQLPCVYGVCRIYDKEKQFCSCYNYTVMGELCDKRWVVPEPEVIIINNATISVEKNENVTEVWVIIVVVAAIVIMLSMVLITCCVMWKRRTYNYKAHVKPPITDTV